MSAARAADHTDRAADTPRRAGAGDPAVVLRRPRETDARFMHELVSRCPPLDANSLYCYLLQASHHSHTGTVAEIDGRVAGFQTGYRIPERPNVLFIWQIAVAPEARGRGLARRMVEDVVRRLHREGVRYLELTVGPKNAASRGLFISVARRIGAPVVESEGWGSAHFGDARHEPERLLRIGPFSGADARTRNPGFTRSLS